MGGFDFRQLDPPDRPGVYLMRDIQRRLLYVGKAISLRKRLATYFRSPEKADPKTQALVAKIAHVEIMMTDTELDALLLENTLIKKHRPRYNVFLKDDKSYPYLKMTVQDALPRLLATRRPFVDEARYFGPFPTGSLAATARSISRHFRLCQRKPGPLPRRTCLYDQMGQCDGACVGRISAAEYAAKVKAAIGFLEGGPDEVTPELEARMRAAAEARDFEAAAGLRDQIAVIRLLRHQPVVATQDRTDRDVVGLARSGGSATVEIFQVRGGNLEGRRHFYLQAAGAHATAEILAQVLAQYYSQPVTIPPAVVVPEKPEGAEVTARWLSGLRGGRTRLIYGRTPEIKRLLKLAETNAWLHLKHSSADANADASEENQKRLADLAARLDLPAPPRRVEAYDISNISGQDAVGSRVVFSQGEPDKAAYRRYRIRSVRGPNDFAMLQEVLFRRLKRLAGEADAAPDLIVVDGGAGQLSAAREVLRELNLSHLAAIGLAKENEEIYQSGRKEPLRLPRSSPALKLLTRLRDEAHRFAIAYHRRLRGKRMQWSLLNQIPGLGPERRRRLLRSFGSVEALLQVSDGEVAQAAGVSLELARSLQDALRRARR
ncbi:MAG: excinuclease ABC subunit UvrC [candidate division FCPU426 bacterium]